MTSGSQSSVARCASTLCGQRIDMGGLLVIGRNEADRRLPAQSAMVSETLSATVAVVAALYCG